MIRPTVRARIGSLATVLAVLTTACSSSPAGVHAFAGRYQLRAVDGQSVPVDALGGAISGELVLTADGRFTRIVTYARSGLPDPFVSRTEGTYRVNGSEITFQVVLGRPPLRGSVWDIAGKARLPSIFVEYPGPADAPVEEEYVRTTK
jgi:hypothetical protein